jgi:hypothetical protein
MQGVWYAGKEGEEFNERSALSISEEKQKNDLKGKFSDNISWYAETVKLDLEARKKIERTSSKPQKYRLK